MKYPRKDKIVVSFETDRALAAYVMCVLSEIGMTLEDFLVEKAFDQAYEKGWCGYVDGKFKMYSKDTASHVLEIDTILQDMWFDRNDKERTPHLFELSPDVIERLENMTRGYGSNAITALEDFDLMKWKVGIFKFNGKKNKKGNKQ